MVSLVDKNGAARFALDAARQEAFTQRPFTELIGEAHIRGQDYYIARVHCLDSPNGAESTSDYSYYCYDAKQLCKYVFEMVISAEGRRIRIKNFRDPINQKEISEINFFRLRSESDTPMRAEFIGNHVTFLESNVFRSKLFFQEDALDALSVNFQFRNPVKPHYIEKKGFFDLFLIVVMLLLVGIVAFAAVKIGRQKLPFASSPAIVKKPQHKLI